MSMLFAASPAAAWPWLRGCCLAGLGAIVAACTQTTAATPGHLPGSGATTEVSKVDSNNGGNTAAAIDPRYVKQRVRYPTTHPAGTVVVDAANKFLYLIMEEGYALRYGIGVGREGFGWTGTADIRRKTEWPKWTPPTAMIKRQPELEKYRHGMPGGADNPLGARALYLFQNGKDTLYRIHGTSEAESIGQNVSSGCIRLMNDDVVDLFNRIPVGTKVVVLPDTSPQEQIAGAGQQTGAVR